MRFCGRRDKETSSKALVSNSFLLLLVRHLLLVARHLFLRDEEGTRDVLAVAWASEDPASNMAFCRLWLTQM